MLSDKHESCKYHFLKSFGMTRLEKVNLGYTDCEADAICYATTQLHTLSSFPKSSRIKRLSKMVFTASLLGAQHKKGIVRRTSQQACLSCPWERHLTGCLHLHMANRWQGQAVYPSRWPSLTKDMQAEHELICINKKTP